MRSVRLKPNKSPLFPRDSIVVQRLDPEICLCTVTIIGGLVTVNKYAQLRSPAVSEQPLKVTVGEAPKQEIEEELNVVSGTTGFPLAVGYLNVPFFTS